MGLTPVDLTDLRFPGAGTDAVRDTLAGQWKDYIYCDALSNDTLMMRGKRREAPGASGARSGEETISDGSSIIVADGQCAIVTEQGKIADVCAEPGEFVWNRSAEPSVFSGKLGESLAATFTALRSRYEHGGLPFLS